ncbi:glycosyltransferase family 4 protein [Caenimonas aquaedulcis]|uniref:Glycosyltransferase family 4 protein n=1 Tax=Caenimonas aquaedulcis TaxID=2793270 RepID=A0A931MHH6_9BURK|nr:glycosyltransferase family 4 protein [Caenimonas aquaedulcis]MBG9388190.1 glycosyltransferase family 4 protein [Caenimonas aquaedulcis]
MDVLFIHPNFPGQFRRVAAALARQPGMRVIGMGDQSWMDPARAIADVPVIAYPKPGDSAMGAHAHSRSFDAAVRRGHQVVTTLSAHKQQGLEPDVIFVHPGWGDGFYLRDFFPGAKVVGLFEYYYHPRGTDVGFDPEFPSSFEDIFRLRTTNATQLLALDSCDEGFSPTAWQRSLFPAAWRYRLSLLHEGVETDVVAPDPNAQITLPDGTVLKAGDEVLTYVSRNLEPYRGYHIFMRALPAILQARPECHVVIVGGDGVSYGKKPEPGTTWKQKYLDEVKDGLDLSRVHFTDTLPYETYVKVLQVSRVHVYLTYPFILSWSMLEAMSAGCLVLASGTPPVEEVISHGDNGLLFPFLQPQRLADAAIEALADPVRFLPLREQARKTIEEKFDFHRVTVPGYLRMMEG